MITYLWQGMEVGLGCDEEVAGTVEPKLLYTRAKRGKKLTNNNVNVWKIYYPGGKNEKV